MKRFLAILLAAVLLLALAAPALAEEWYGGDVLKHKAKAYSTKNLKGYLFTIPTNTVVSACINPPWCAVGKNYTYYKVSKIRYKGVTCYVKTKYLLQDNYHNYGVFKLPKKTKIYERPLTSSACKKLKKAQEVYLCGTRGRWALVRTLGYDHDGQYGFVKFR